MNKLFLILIISSSSIFSNDWAWELTEETETDIKSDDDSLHAKLIKYYQEYSSPIQGERCPFYPSCSHYVLESMKLFGFELGLIMGIERIYYRENKGLFRKDRMYEKVRKNGKQKLYDIPWANNIFIESFWFFYNPGFYIEPSDSR